MHPFENPVTCTPDLEAFWGEVVATWKVTGTQVFVALFEMSGRPVPSLINVSESSLGSYPAMVSGLVRTIAIAIEDVAPGGSAAILVARAGPLDATTEVVAALITEELTAADFTSWPVFVSSDHGLSTVTGR